MSLSDDSADTGRRPQTMEPANLLEARLGGRPSPWAVTLLWASLAVLGVVLALLVSSYLF